MKDLQMELIQLNEAIDMITVVLDKQEQDGEKYDPQLVEQLRKLLKEREELIKEDGVTALMNLNPTIQALWEEFREAVKVYGHGAETKQILVKIYEIRKEANDVNS